MAFEAAIQEIDNNYFDVIGRRAIVFKSNNTCDQLFAILSNTGIECPPDEFFILTLKDSFTGNGLATTELKEFFK